MLYFSWKAHFYANFIGGECVTDVSIIQMYLGFMTLDYAK